MADWCLGSTCVPRLATLCVRALVSRSVGVASAPLFVRQLVLDQAARFNLLCPAAARLAADVPRLDLSCQALTEAVVASFAPHSAAVTTLNCSRTPAVRPAAWRKLARAVADSLAVLDLSHSGSKGLLASFASRAGCLRIVRADSALSVTDNDVIQILQKCELLQELSLRRCNQLTNKCLVRGLPPRSYLMHLDVRDVRKLTDPALVAVASRCPTLLSLSLEGQKFVHGLTSVLNMCTELERLAFPCCSVDEDALLRIRNTQCRVRDLDMFGSIFSEPTLLFLFGNVFRRLQKVNLAGVRHLSLNVFRYVVRRSPNLRTLSLKGHLTRVRDDFLDEIAANLHSLDSLDLGLCRSVTSDGIYRLLERLPTCLRSVDLVSLPFLEDRVVSLVAERFGARLEKLSVGGCQKVSDESLALLVKYCTNLRSLCLKGTAIASAPLLLKLLSRNPDLRSLSLSGVKAVDDSLLQTLDSSCDKLASVYLSGVSLSQEKENAYRISHPRVQVFGKRTRHPI